jgi:hypothetical protein
MSWTLCLQSRHDKVDAYQFAELKWFCRICALSSVSSVAAGSCCLSSCILFASSYWDNNSNSAPIKTTEMSSMTARSPLVIASYYTTRR